MLGGHVVYRFGGFELDPQRRKLRRGTVVLPLSGKPIDILHVIAKLAPGSASKEAMRVGGWGAGDASEANMRVQLSRIRKEVGDCIETLPEGACRMTCPVEVVPADQDARGGDGLAQAAFLKVLRGLATLTRCGLAAARQGCEDTLARRPNYAPALAELALTYAFEFEATRFSTNDRTLLTRALALAEEVTRHHPTFSDGWSILGFILSLLGETDRAVAAAREACDLEHDCLEHVIRLSFVCWGDARVRAAHEALRLQPGLGLAYWLKITVYIARGAFDMALSLLEQGCDRQDAQRQGPANYRAVGLHLLRGLVLAARGRLPEAIAAFEKELEAPERDLLYEQECRANTWYAIGAIRRRMGDHRGARDAFREALKIAPNHLFSMAALGMELPEVDPSHPRATDVTIARAIGLACAGRHAEAAAMYERALTDGPHPNTGWILPVEPILQPLDRPEIWKDALAIVQDRAM